MADFDYKQRAATPEYRENWERVFSPKRATADRTPDAAGPLARAEASGVPALLPSCAHEFVEYVLGNTYCIACHVWIHAGAPKQDYDNPYTCRCGSQSFRRSSTDYRVIVCSACGEDLW